MHLNIHNMKSPKEVFLCSHVRIYLNGTEMQDVIEVNEEEKYLVRASRDENGSLMINEERNEIVTERLEGHVEVRLPRQIKD